MQAVHTSVLFAIDNSSAFFPAVWKEWPKSSRRARLTYFNVESGWGSGDVGGLTVEPIAAPSRRNIFDMELKLELKQSPEGYLGCVEYDRLVYSKLHVIRAPFGVSRLDDRIASSRNQ